MQRLLSDVTPASLLSLGCPMPRDILKWGDLLPLQTPGMAGRDPSLASRTKQSRDASAQEGIRPQGSSSSCQKSNIAPKQPWGRYCSASTWHRDPGSSATW